MTLTETNAQSVEKLAEVPEWLTYDIPRTVAGRAARECAIGVSRRPQLIPETA